eukprot:1158810-Pelagomonas_calceolata.AAC.3
MLHLKEGLAHFLSCDRTLLTAIRSLLTNSLHQCEDLLGVSNDTNRHLPAVSDRDRHRPLLPPSLCMQTVSHPCVGVRAPMLAGCVLQVACPTSKYYSFYWQGPQHHWNKFP